eukprot:CAMPEP_0115133044 /NCGR_PEP_ID=MMETSP0227-20121206/54156_1 /TAXON_ID=89957 /ORGANISM="Polarella glacialis, Strain CCMP 1383" /LENGTH=85 /DNA_ID=CAMNT_0002539037 /DNA_START=369 /DNA_END=622 /DNA_ORIENTATION=-
MTVGSRELLAASEEARASKIAAPNTLLPRATPRSVFGSTSSSITSSILLSIAGVAANASPGVHGMTGPAPSKSSVRQRLAGGCMA